MPKKRENLKRKVLFNASVIIAGAYSPNGGSGKLLKWVKSGKINGIISEVILDEVQRHTDKFTNIFKNASIAPDKVLVDKYQKTVADPGDAHLFATAQETKADFLVSLDKEHILILQSKIKKPKIVSPGELIKNLS